VTQRFTQLAVPTLVVHGTDDPLIPFENGLRVHRAVRGSRLLKLDGVGHDLPPGAAEQVLQSLIEHASAG
jgi:pimeloyl-ACP methyl ester carboxylesterase